jgi:hypothetical protein
MATAQPTNLDVAVDDLAQTLKNELDDELARDLVRFFEFSRPGGESVPYIRFFERVVKHFIIRVRDYCNQRK